MVDHPVISHAEALRAVLAVAARTLTVLRRTITQRLPEPYERRDWACKECVEDSLNVVGFRCAWHRTPDLVDQLEAALAIPSPDKQHNQEARVDDTQYGAPLATAGTNDPVPTDHYALQLTLTLTREGESLKDSVVVLGDADFHVYGAGETIEAACADYAETLRELHASYTSMSDAEMTTDAQRLRDRLTLLAPLITPNEPAIPSPDLRAFIEQCRCEAHDEEGGPWEAGYAHGLLHAADQLSALLGDPVSGHTPIDLRCPVLYGRDHTRCVRPVGHTERHLASTGFAWRRETP